MIRGIAVAALAVGGLNLTTVAPAEAQTGFLCGFSSTDDPTADGNVRTAVVRGGPLFAADFGYPGEETADIAISCVIQVDAKFHAGADSARATSTFSPGAAVLPPTPLSYVAPPGSSVYLCTEAFVNGQVRYYDETGDDFTRGWSTTHWSQCYFAFSQPYPEPDLIEQFVSDLVGQFGLLGCDDGLDNDGDGRVDSADPGCSGPSDSEERGSIVCDNGWDDDGDGLADYPADRGCTDPGDVDESGAGGCADGLDNDGDTAADYPADPGCTSSTDPDERGTSTCDNGADDDGDGLFDYPVDPGCSGPSDSSERGSSLPCDDTVDNDSDGFTDYPNDPGCRSAADPNETTIP